MGVLLTEKLFEFFKGAFREGILTNHNCSCSGHFQAIAMLQSYHFRHPVIANGQVDHSFKNLNVLSENNYLLRKHTFIILSCGTTHTPHLPIR